MKKIIVTTLVVITLVSCLASCGGKFTCDLCGEEKSGKKYEQESFGEKITLCKECRDDVVSMWE